VAGLERAARCARIPGLKIETRASQVCLKPLWMMFRLLFAYAIGMSEMKRQIAWENEQSSRYASTVAICASIIAAVRLARDDIGGSSPKLTCAVADSVNLARVILKRVLAR
jgi:hypothetical protein